MRIRDIASGETRRPSIIPSALSDDDTLFVLRPLPALRYFPGELLTPITGYA